MMGSLLQTNSWVLQEHESVVVLPSRCGEIGLGSSWHLLTVGPLTRPPDATWRQVPFSKVSSFSLLLFLLCFSLPSPRFRRLQELLMSLGQ